MTLEAAPGAGTVGRATVEWGELRDAIWPDAEGAPRRVLRCRHCGQRNRVNVALAVSTPERHTCARCAGPLFLERDAPLSGLPAEAYQHCLDRRTIAALNSIPGLPSLIRHALESVGDQMAQMLFMADTVQCGSDQFPELVRLTERARTRLGLSFSPTVYLGESPHMNALTTGARAPVIVVRSALLDQMSDDELLSILGHELGHLHAGHPVHQAVARALIQGGFTASPALRVLSLPVHRILLRWLRHAELTADRAALLACRDLRACVAVMLTFAGGNRPGTSSRTQIRVGPFVRQCRELSASLTTRSLDGLLGQYLSMDRTHPYVAVRVIELIRWVEHGSYLDILSGNYLRLAANLERALPRAATPALEA